MWKVRLPFLILCISLLLAFTVTCNGGAAAVTPPPDPPIQPGESTHSITHAGTQRDYLLYIPQSFDPGRPAPVVLVFHGFGMQAKEMIRITGFNDQADADGFVVVYPQGDGDDRAWNGGDCCGMAARDQVDDVGFVSALIEDLATMIDIDRRRIFATGFSNGAIMSYQLACALSEQIAAIAPVAATQAAKQCQPGRPVSIQHFHGTADHLNPYFGATRGRVIFASVDETIQFWVDHNGCLLRPQTEKFGGIFHKVHRSCEGDTAVELYTILEGEHAWPGGESVRPEIGEPTSEISATPLIWEFFSAHPLPEHGRVLP